MVNAISISSRDRVHQGLSAARGRAHPYAGWRIAVGVVFTVLTALIPLLGILRFDFWGGRHVLLGEQMDLVSAAKAFAFPFLGINVAILLITRFWGRWLCGFVCPIGSLARVGEWVNWKAPRRALFAREPLALAFLSLTLAAITFSYWIDWRVFRDGSMEARFVCGSLLVGMTLMLHLGARHVGLSFCRGACPSGVYFSLLGAESTTGVHFPHPEACTDCGACDTVCPMDLAPRQLLDGPPREQRGLYPEHSTNLSLCIRCGDCVRACEGTNLKREEPTPLALGFLPAARDRA